jgi:uncharacterized protein (DUF58 family)
MLTRAAHGILIVGTSLLTLGLATANPLLVGLSTVPLAAALLGVTESTPEIENVRIDAPETARAGDAVEVDLAIETDGTPGLLAVAVDLPETFDVVEGDSARLVDLDRGQTDTSWTLRLRAGKRGHERIGPVRAAPIATRGLQAIPAKPVAEARSIEVRPILVPVRRLESMRGTAATIAPDEDAARIGLETTDFRELREYRYGDPQKNVNWKATARLGPAADKPLVNEYEVEGRKAVWFMLDAGRHMAIGTNIENGFEAGVAAVSGLALAYTERGYRVGLHVYNEPGSDPIFPDVGEQQRLKIQRRLARVELSDTDTSPLEAVVECRSWLARDKPMVVFVTRADHQLDELEAAIRRVRAMSPEHPQPVVVIEPVGYHLVPGGEIADVTARLLEHAAKPRYQRLRDLGAVVIPWNPREQPLERLLFYGVIQHR